MSRTADAKLASSHNCLMRVDLAQLGYDAQCATFSVTHPMRHLYPMVTKTISMLNYYIIGH